MTNVTDTVVLGSIVGKRFGQITVSERLSGAKYSVICDCGVKKTARYSELVSGRIVSCGCMRNKPKCESIVGMRSGRLVVIERTNIKRGSSYLWRCCCDCGKEILEEAYRIKNGHVRSCGCSRKYNRMKDITGQKFGRLTAIERLEKKEGHCYKWLCKCECGKSTEVSTTRLTHGLVRSCGCVLIEKH